MEKSAGFDEKKTESKETKADKSYQSIEKHRRLETNDTVALSLVSRGAWDARTIISVSKTRGASCYW